MNMRTINLTVGAVLAALLTVAVINVCVNALFPTGAVAPKVAEAPKPATEAPKTATAEAPKAPAADSTTQPAETKPAVAETAPAAEPEKPLAQLLAAASADAGATEAKKCALCHTFEKNGPPKVGPNLYGIVGRPVGKQDNFPYSAGVQNHGGNWDYKLLDCYIKDPKACIPGNKMAFVGIKKDTDRANVIAYLRSLSDAPVPLPTE